MRKMIKYVFLAWLSILGLHAQQAFTAGGGTGSGSGGTMSFSIGQVLYRYYSGTNGSISEGVQQASNVTISSFENTEAQKAEAINLIVIPNPASEQIQVNLKGTKVVYNSTGIEVIHSNASIINVSQLPAGMYHLYLQQGNSRQKTTFIKR
jgi:hypothetical protein